MPSHTVTDKGALTGLTLDEEDKKQAPVVYNVYQTQAQTPEMDLSNLQDVYGTTAMPIFNWVRTIATGQRTYDPSDDEDRKKLEEYKRLTENQPPPGLPSFSDIAKGLGATIGGQVASRAAGQIGSALVDPYLASQPVTSRILTGASETFGSTPLQQVSSITSKAVDNLGSLQQGDVLIPELANRNVAEATGNLDLFNDLSGSRSTTKVGDALTYKTSDLTKKNIAVDSAGNVTNNSGKGSLTAEALTQSTKTPTYFSEVGDRLYGTPEAAQNWSGAATGGLVSFGLQLATGVDPAKAAKSAGAQVIGTAIGNSLFPGIGGVVGGAIGGLVGGRVICNELCRQRLLSREDVIRDYKFTHDHLTPRHVTGYHIWAVGVVKKLRKGKSVKFWHHIAKHRANQIAYLYCDRDKPDNLGRIYRFIFEPACWFLGMFCKETDWSVLYNKKEKINGA